MTFHELTGVQKFFGDVAAVEDYNLAAERGEFVSFLGPSGCGNTTTLRMIAGFEHPTSGTIVVDGRDITRQPPNRRNVGMVFQSYALFPNMTVADNIALPCLLGGVKPAEAETRAAALAERVGITHRLHHYPQQISGGEMQRAAIARALIHQPLLVVADEPTGNLDSENGANVLALLEGLNTEMGVTILLATHAADVAAAAKRILRMKDGKFDDRQT